MIHQQSTCNHEIFHEFNDRIENGILLHQKRGVSDIDNLVA